MHKNDAVGERIEVQGGLETILLSTGQHRQMLDQVFDVFNEHPDYDLEIMKPGQSLFDITTNILNKIKSRYLHMTDGSRPLV